MRSVGAGDLTSWVSVAGMNTGGNGNNGTWTFAIDYTQLHGSAGLGDVYQYFVPVPNSQLPILNSHLLLKRQFKENKLEMMDQPDADPEMLVDDLHNLRIINRYFGGLSALRNAVVPIAMKTNPKEVATILDLATGSGDQPVSLAKAFRRLGKRVQITAVDKNEIMLNAARQHASGFHEIQFERADILNLPYSTRALMSYLAPSRSIIFHPPME